MKCYEYEAMTYDGDIYCTECLPNGVTEEDAFPIFADSEWDIAPVCNECGFVHEYMSILGEDY